MICFECGKLATYKHHVVPKSRGGKKTTPLCADCHIKIHGQLSLSVSELTKAALRFKWTQHEKTGGDVPFGFRARDGRLILDAGEQTIIRGIVKQHKRGASLRTICKRLERDGAKRKGGSMSWHPEAVRRVLERETRAEIHS